MHVKRLRRRGFTLMELLVVVSIIGVLVALTTAAVVKFRVVGMRSATSTNLGQVFLKSREQWKGVTDKAQKTSLDASGQDGLYAARARAIGGGSLETQRDAFVTLKQTQMFPTNFNEVFWPDATWKPAKATTIAPYAWQAYVAYLAELGITPANEASWGAVSADAQAGVCLLMILQKGSSSATTADDLSTSLRGTVDLPGGVKGPALIDSWKRPVMFTRTYQGKAATLAILSAGVDGQFGTDLQFNVVSASVAADNVLVINP